MKRVGVLLSGVLAWACATSLRAAEAADFPAGTKWVLNLDLKAAQACPMINYAVEKIAPAKRRDAQAKIAAIKALFGVDLAKDIREIVIAGTGGAESGGVAYIYANLDTERLTTILAGNSTFTATDHSGFKLLSWVDDTDKKHKFGAFVRPGLTVMSDKKACLLEALDVLAGKKPALASDSALKPALAHAEQEIVSLLAVDLPAVVGEKPQAQALRQASALSLRVRSAAPDALAASLSVTASSNETAVQIRQALMGIQALALLRAAEAPEQAAFASLARITGEGSAVGVTLTLSKSALDEMIRQRDARQAAEAAARAEAAVATPPVPAGPQ